MRTALERSFPFSRTPTARNSLPASAAEFYRQWQHLASVMTTASLVTGGCSTAVALVAGIVERKRPFSLLRLSGTSLRGPRRVLLVEGAAPLLLGAATTVGLGLLATDLFLQAQMDQHLHALLGVLVVESRSSGRNTTPANRSVGAFQKPVNRHFKDFRVK